MNIKIKDKIIKCGIPRYYEKWFKKEKPAEWKHYVTHIKYKIMKEAQDIEEETSLEERKENFLRAAQMGLQYTKVMTRRKSEKIILEQKFKQLNKHQKDI